MTHCQNYEYQQRSGQEINTAGLGGKDMEKLLDSISLLIEGDVSDTSDSDLKEKIETVCQEWYPKMPVIAMYMR